MRPRRRSPPAASGGEAIYQGLERRGFVRQGEAGFLAINNAGRIIGAFATRTEAMRAVLNLTGAA